MVSVERLETFAEADDQPGAKLNEMSVKLRHDAVLTDGRRVLLLDDRGWSSTMGAYAEREEDLPDPSTLDIWASTTAEEIEYDSKITVGPDEEYEEYTQDQMDEFHWAALAQTLYDAGVTITPEKLSQLPHDVVLSDTIRTRLGQGPNRP